MAYPMKHREPWYQYAANRRSDHLRRVRVCVRCGLERETIEFSTKMPKPASTPDRCPKCIIGPGRVRYVKRRGEPNFAHKTQESIGCVVRKRRCTECKTTWTTYETLPGAARHPDITRCECGARMRPRRRN